MATSSMDALTWFRNQVETADADLLREMITSFAGALMSAEVEALCGAGFGERTPERVNSRNGYRERTWDTRVGTIDLAIPKLRAGSYFPDWLLQPRRRSERALVAVVAECYLRGVSTRRVEGLVQTLGIERLSKSQVSVMAKELDQMVASLRNRPLDPAGYPYLWVDALTQRVREEGRIVNVCAVVATGVTADGKREILGVDVVSAEDGAAWTAFLRGLVARGLRGVRLVISDAHEGLKNAISAILDGASLAALSDPLHAEPARPGAEVGAGRGGHPGALHLRPTRRREHLGPARPDRRAAARAVPPGGRAARGGHSRPARLHRLPQGALAADLVQQPPGTAQQGAPPPHRRSRHLPPP